jgi:tellurite methyltransferase
LYHVLSTKSVLCAGWSVLAIDKQSEALVRVQSKVLPAQQDRLKTQIVGFEEAVFPPVDLVFAGFSLPFCSPQQFDSVWSRIVAAIRPGGRFAGQLFGDRDSWANNANMTFHTVDEARNLFKMFEIESFNEIDKDGSTALGKPKHWHIYETIARKCDRHS